MAGPYKKVTLVKLKHGDSLEVSLEEGVKVREQKARGSGVVFLTEHNNRMIDVAMIGDIEDVTVEDHSQPEIVDHTKGLIAAGLLEPEVDLRLAPGYIKYVVAGVKLRKGKNTAQIKAKLDEEQLKLVEAEMERQGVTW